MPPAARWRRGLGGGNAASRSIAVTAGKDAGSDGVRPGGIQAPAAGRRLHRYEPVSTPPPQRMQRIFLPGSRRDADTSYVAAQVGQVIRMKTYYY